jgi:hypothetical protein
MSVITNSALQILLKQSPTAVDNLQKLFYLTEGEKYVLLNSGVGQGIFFAGNKHVAIQIIASPEEAKVVTTKPEEVLAHQAAEKAQREMEERASQPVSMMAAGPTPPLPSAPAAAVTPEATEPAPEVVTAPSAPVTPEAVPAAMAAAPVESAKTEAQPEPKSEPNVSVEASAKEETAAAPLQSNLPKEAANAAATVTKESDLGSILAAMDTPVATSAAEEPPAKEEKKAETDFRGGKILGDEPKK